MSCLDNYCLVCVMEMLIKVLLSALIMEIGLLEICLVKCALLLNLSCQISLDDLCITDINTKCWFQSAILSMFGPECFALLNSSLTHSLVLQLPVNRNCLCSNIVQYLTQESLAKVNAERDDHYQKIAQKRNFF